MVYIALIVYCACLFLAFVLYIPKFCQYAGAKKKPEHKIASDKRNIAILIPARDESDTIGPLFESLKNQTYDKRFFTVNVIVDSEDDPTIAMAKEFGANVYVVPEQKSKGDALNGYFKALPEAEFAGYDAFALIDADAILTENYIEELNNALEHTDRQIFITRKHIKNYLGDRKSRSLTCNCATLIYPSLDDLGNSYRTEKNMPLNFCGQGLMLRRSVIEKKGGWAYRTLTEDFELKLDSVLQDFTSMYYPYAIIYTEEVISHKNSYERRLRWLTGHSRCEKDYGKQVKAKLKKDKASAAMKFDFLHYRNGVFVYLLSTVLAVVTGIVMACLYARSGNRLWIDSVLLLIVFPLALTYVLLWLYSLLAMVCYRDAFKPVPLFEKFLTLAVAPFFLLEFVPLYVHSALRAHKNCAWKKTARETIRLRKRY